MVGASLPSAPLPLSALWVPGVDAVSGACTVAAVEPPASAHSWGSDPFRSLGPAAWHGPMMWVTRSLLHRLLGYSCAPPPKATPLRPAAWQATLLVPWAALPHQGLRRVALTRPPNSSSGPFPVSVQSQADPSSSRHRDLSSEGDRPEGSAAPDTNHLWLVSDRAAPSRLAGVGASRVLSFTCAQHKSGGSPECVCSPQ